VKLLQAYKFLKKPEKDPLSNPSVQRQLRESVASFARIAPSFDSVYVADNNKSYYKIEWVNYYNNNTKHCHNHFNHNKTSRIKRKNMTGPKVKEEMRREEVCLW
jgi:hypothetical protein